MHLYEIRGLNFKILKLFVETSEPNGMKNLAIQNRVLQRDRVLQRRILERDYCIIINVIHDTFIILKLRPIDDLKMP